MQTRVILILSAILLFLLEARGQNADLHELMAQEDYISCSLLTVAPGDKIYSSGGHMAIRMNCPIQDVDYTYEFDAVASGNDSFTANFLNGTLKGAYQRLYTNDFFSKAASESRAVAEYSLSLTPSQEVRLWSMLDDAVDSGRLYSFTPADYNCCSMLLRILQSSVGEGFSFYSDGEVLTEDNGRHYIEECFSASPWVGLLWNILLGGDFDRDKQPINLLYPKNAASFLSTVKNPATSDNLISPIKKSDTVFPEASRCVFTPMALFLILLGISLLLIVPSLKGKFRLLCRIFDGLLLLSTTAVGCVLWYMFFASLWNPPVYLNILLLIFNPIPIILLLFRKKKYWMVYEYIIIGICIILIIGMPVFPQLRHYGLWIFLLAIVARGITQMAADMKDKVISTK